VGWTGVERDPPSQDADPLDHLLFRQHNVISRRQALRHLTRTALYHQVDSGRWQQPVRSVFVAQTGPIGVPQQRWIGVLASRGPLAAFSALEVLGLKGYAKPYTEILITANRRVRLTPPATVIRRSACLTVEDVLTGGSPPTTVAARSLVDAAQWARDDAEAVAVIAAGFQQRLVFSGEVLAVLDRLSGVRREALIRQAVQDARGGSHSISEVQFLQLCRRNGLPEPTRQMVRKDSRGRKRYRDALFEEFGIHVEIDGAQHMEVRAWSADMVQHNEIAITGDRLLRFTAWQIRREPETVARQLRAALVAAGWRPS
jgi:very-short-patch-repair endonuclease